MYEHNPVKTEPAVVDKQMQEWWAKQAIQEKRTGAKKKTRPVTRPPNDSFQIEREHYEELNELRSLIAKKQRRIEHLEACYRNMRNRHYRYAKRIMQLAPDERMLFEKFFQLEDIIMKGE